MKHDLLLPIPGIIEESYLQPGKRGCHENIHKEVAVFVFGASLFDPGNNNFINTIPVFQANYLPYGESYFSPPTGRFSNGRLIVDFIAEYARFPLIPLYLEPGNNEFTYGANFASAASGALNETFAGLTILGANELWDIIEPVDNAQLDIKKDMAATTYLYQALPEDMILQVASCNSAKEI
nr:GDSL esterase/lipase 1-like [Tanacetum cinerariifolium]